MADKVFTEEQVSISLSNGDSVTGILLLPGGKKKQGGDVFIIAHGQGNGMKHPLLVTFAEGLAAAGYANLRFNFLFKEKGQDSTDKKDKLYLAWDKVRDRDSVDAYVRRIMVNENNSLWRRAWKRRELSTGDVPEGPGSQKSWWWWPWYEHQNLRDERAEAFSTLLWEGVYTYSYVTRATTPGQFVVPPAKAEEMYAPETFGRSAVDRVIVE